MHHTKTDVKTLSATSVNGTAVVNIHGENLGHIEDLMIDLSTGNIAYAVLSFGGILGVGDKLFAIPWQALQFDTEEEKVILNVEKNRLESAPGFDKNNWPNTADRSWLSEVYTYYGYSYKPLIPEMA